MSALPALLKEIADDTAEAQAIRDANPLPLAGGDLAAFTTLINGAMSKAKSAKGDDWFDGLTATELTKPAATTWTAFLATCAAEAAQIQNDGGPAQGCLDRLKTIKEHGPDAIAEVT